MCPLALSTSSWKNVSSGLLPLFGWGFSGGSDSNSSTVWETWVQSLGWEDPLEKEMATHSSILTWRIPWTEEPGGLQSTGLQRVGHDWACTHREKYKIRSLGDFHLVISPTNYN